MSVLLGMLLLGGGLQAQSWYQIELLLFVQDGQQAAAGDASIERWPDTFRPQWPTPMIRMGSSTSPSPALRPLPQGQRRLNNDAAALRRNPGYQVLWHQAWQQPLLPQEQSPWIQVQAGQSQQDTHQLEGAVRVHLERFLHLSLDLWLSDLDRASFSSHAPAPFQLPALEPVPPACYFLSRHWPRDQGTTPTLSGAGLLQNWWYPPFGCMSDLAGRGLFPLSQAVTPAIQVELPSASYEVVGSGERRVNRAELLASPIMQDVRPDDADQQEAGSQVRAGRPVAGIIPFRQTRRMRSDELHYLDHPRMGALVLITPMQAPAVTSR